MDRDEEQRRRRGEHTRSYSQDRPIGSGENARSLVRGVKQWLPDIPGSVGDMADMLYAGGANVLQGQKQRSIAPLGAGPAIRRAIGKKAPLEQVEMRATPETDWWEEGARFANPAAFMSPKNIAGLGGLALAGGVPGAELGMIRRGGRTDLNMVHNIDDDPRSIAEFFAQRGSMTNPSIAIAKDKVYPFALKPTLVMNPSSHAFDPRTAQANQLINRDAYTTRDKTPKMTAEHRLPRRPGRFDLISPSYGDTRLTEHFYPDPDQAASILASPRYKSLAEYERNKSGAGSLGTFDEDAGARSSRLLDHYNAWLSDSQVRRVMGLSKREMDFRKMQMLRAAARSGDREAERILRGFQNLPSEYGELKVLGELPIDRKNVSAMIVPAHYDGEDRDTLVDAAQRLGIKAGYPMDLIPAEYKSLYEDITKGVVGDVRRVSQLADDKRDYSGLNGLTKRYVDKPLYYDMLEDPANAESLARDMIPRSDAIAADAASILTAKDAYADGGLVGRQEFNGAVGYILD